MSIEKHVEKSIMNEVEDIIEAYENGSIYEYMNDRVIEIRKDEDYELEKLVFTIGGPYVYLNMQTRQVIGETFSNTYKKSIPVNVWDNLECELTEMFRTV